MVHPFYLVDFYKVKTLEKLNINLYDSMILLILFTQEKLKYVFT